MAASDAESPTARVRKAGGDQHESLTMRKAGGGTPEFVTLRKQGGDHELGYIIAVL